MARRQVFLTGQRGEQKETKTQASKPQFYNLSIEKQTEILNNIEADFNFLLDENPDTGLTHGGATGIDTEGSNIFKKVLKERGLSIEEIEGRITERPADWKKYGKAAGPMRNLIMGQTQRVQIGVEPQDKDVVIFAHPNIEDSAGTANAVKLAELSGRLIYKAGDVSQGKPPHTSTTSVAETPNLFGAQLFINELPKPIDLEKRKQIDKTDEEKIDEYYKDRKGKGILKPISDIFTVNPLKEKTYPSQAETRAKLGITSKGGYREGEGIVPAFETAEARQTRIAIEQSKGEEQYGPFFAGLSDTAKEQLKVSGGTISAREGSPISVAAIIDIIEKQHLRNPNIITNLESVYDIKNHKYKIKSPEDLESLKNMRFQDAAGNIMSVERAIINKYYPSATESKAKIQGVLQLSRVLSVQERLRELNDKKKFEISKDILNMTPQEAESHLIKLEEQALGSSNTIYVTGKDKKNKPVSIGDTRYKMQKDEQDSMTEEQKKAKGKLRWVNPDVIEDEIDGFDTSGSSTSVGLGAAFNDKPSKIALSAQIREYSKNNPPIKLKSNLQFPPGLLDIDAKNISDEKLLGLGLGRPAFDDDKKTFASQGATLQDLEHHSPDAKYVRGATIIKERVTELKKDEKGKEIPGDYKVEGLTDVERNIIVRGMEQTSWRKKVDPVNGKTFRGWFLEKILTRFKHGSRLNVDDYTDLGAQFMVKGDSPIGMTDEDWRDKNARIFSPHIRELQLINILASGPKFWNKLTGRDKENIVQALNNARVNVATTEASQKIVDPKTGKKGRLSLEDKKALQIDISKMDPSKAAEYIKSTREWALAEKQGLHLKKDPSKVAKYTHFEHVDPRIVSHKHTTQAVFEPSTSDKLQLVDEVQLVGKNIGEFDEEGKRRIAIDKGRPAKPEKHEKLPMKQLIKKERGVLIDGVIVPSKEVINVDEVIDLGDIPDTIRGRKTWERDYGNGAVDITDFKANMKDGSLLDELQQIMGKDSLSVRRRGDEVHDGTASVFNPTQESLDLMRDEEERKEFYRREYEKEFDIPELKQRHEQRDEDLRGWEERFGTKDKDLEDFYKDNETAKSEDYSKLMAESESRQKQIKKRELFDIDDYAKEFEIPDYKQRQKRYHVSDAKDILHLDSKKIPRSTNGNQKRIRETAESQWLAKKYAEGWTPDDVKRHQREEDERGADERFGHSLLDKKRETREEELASFMYGHDLGDDGPDSNTLYNMDIDDIIASKEMGGDSTYSAEEFKEFTPRQKRQIAVDEKQQSFNKILKQFQEGEGISKDSRDIMDQIEARREFDIHDYAKEYEIPAIEEKREKQREEAQIEYNKSEAEKLEKARIDYNKTKISKYQISYEDWNRSYSLLTNPNDPASINMKREGEIKLLDSIVRNVEGKTGKDITLNQELKIVADIKNNQARYTDVYMNSIVGINGGTSTPPSNVGTPPATPPSGNGKIPDVDESTFEQDKESYITSNVELHDIQDNVWLNELGYTGKELFNAYSDAASANIKHDQSYGKNKQRASLKNPEGKLYLPVALWMAQEFGKDIRAKSDKTPRFPFVKDDIDETAGPVTTKHNRLVDTDHIDSDMLKTVNLTVTKERAQSLFPNADITLGNAKFTTGPHSVKIRKQGTKDTREPLIDLLKSPDKMAASPTNFFDGTWEFIPENDVGGMGDNITHIAAVDIAETTKIARDQSSILDRYKKGIKTIETTYELKQDLQAKNMPVNGKPKSTTSSFS